MISHKSFDNINEALICSFKKLSILKFGVYCIEDCLKFAENLKDKLIFNINKLKKLISEEKKYTSKFNLQEFLQSQKFVNLDGDFGFPDYLLEEMWTYLRNAYVDFEEYNDNLMLENIYSLFAKAIIMHNRFLGDQADIEAEKKYFSFANSLSTTNTLKDEFFNNLDFNNFDDLCIFFDYLDDKYPKHNLLIKRAGLVGLNFPTGYIIAGNNNLELVEKIINEPWICSYLERLYK